MSTFELKAENIFNKYNYYRLKFSLLDRDDQVQLINSYICENIEDMKDYITYDSIEIIAELICAASNNVNAVNAASILSSDIEAYLIEDTKFVKLVDDIFYDFSNDSLSAPLYAYGAAAAA
jgi:hypothetical protein